MQNVLALLNYYIVEELEIMEGQDYQSNIQNSIRKFEPWDFMMQLINIPLVNCAPEIVQFYFNDPFTFLRMIKPDTYKQHIENLIDALQKHMRSLYVLLGAQNFDQTELNPKRIINFELTHFTDGLDPIFAEYIKDARYETKLWWTVAKICTLIELLTHSEFLPRSSQGFHLYEAVYSCFQSNQMISGENSIVTQVYKLQSLLDRYHTRVFVEWQNSQYNKYLANKDRLQLMFQDEKINWSDYKLDPEIKSNQQELRNLYYIYEYKTLPSLKWCVTVSREDPNLLFDLAESQIISTHKCWKKARQFLARINEMYRRRSKVVHIKNPIDSHNIIFNQNWAGLVITELKAIAKICHQTPVDKLFADFRKCMAAVVMISGRVTWTLPDIAEILNAKSLRNRGFYVLDLLNQGLIDVLKDLLLWSIRATKAMDQLEGPKHILVSQDIQDVLKSVLKVIKPLIDGNFMGMGNLQNFLVPFKSDLSQELIGVKAVESEQSLCAMRLRNFLYPAIYIPVCKLFYQDHMQEILAFAADYQHDAAQILCQIYGQLSNGFKQTLNSIGLTDLIVSPKATSDKPETKPDPNAKAGVKTYEIEMLKEMGFNEDQATKALLMVGNSFDAALELLLTKKDLQDSKETQKDQSPTLNVEVMQQSFDTGQADHKVQFQSLLDILSRSFGYVHWFFGQCPLSYQQQTVNNLFRLFQSEKKLDTEGKQSQSEVVFACITGISKSILTQELQVPLWIEIDFTIQLLKNISKTSHPLIVKHLNALGVKLHQTSKDLAIQSTNPIKQQMNANLIKREQELFKERLAVEQDQRKQSDMHLLFNVNEYLKLAAIITGYVQIYQESRLIDGLIKTEMADSTIGLSSDQLKLIESHQEDDNKKRQALKEKWQQILNLIKPLQESENTIETVQTSSEIALSLFQDEREVGDVLIEIFACIDAVLKSLTNISHSFIHDQYEGVSSCISRSLQLLKSMGEIQTIGLFDFRKQFVQAEMIKTIFDLKVVDEAWESKQQRLLPQDKLTIVLIREVLEGFWLQPKDLSRVYETLIKRQMFYQYKQSFKREEKRELLDVLKTSIVCEQVTSPQLQPNQLGKREFDHANLISSNKKPKTKNKALPQVDKQIRSMRAKSEEKKLKNVKTTGQIMTSRQKTVWPLAPDLCSPKLIKKFIKRTEAYNRQKFNDFLGYFDSSAFGMNIKRVDLFIAAVAKICLIKTEVDAQGGKPETKIMLKRNILRDLLTDPDFHSIVLAQPSIAQQNRLQFETELQAWKQVSVFNNSEQQSFTTRSQQEMVSQLLDCIISQTKGYRMDLLKLFRDPGSALTLSQDKFKINDTIVTLEPLDEGKRAGQHALCVSSESTSVRKEYFFDMFSILNVFVSMLALNLPVAEIILRHNERKTIKFMFRNMFLLFSLGFRGKNEIVIEPIMSALPYVAQKLTVMCNFLNHLMISNFGTRQTDIIVREELQRILITQLAKQIQTEIQADLTGWMRDANLVTAFGPVWLLTNFIMNKFTNEDENAKDVQAAILQKKFKHMRLQRIQMAKLLILECQHQSTKNGNSSSLSLLSNLQRISNILISDLQFFITQAKPKFYQLCIVGMSNIIKMFDTSFTLFQTRPRKRAEQMRILDMLKDASSKVGETSEIMQMLDKDDYGEEGEDEFEEIEEEEEEQMDDQEDEESEEVSSDSYGSDNMSGGINDLSSHSEGRDSFDGGAHYDDDHMESDEEEDYGSSENLWEQDFYDIQEVDVEEPEVIVTTKQDYGSPRHYISDYDEEDSSSNFQAGAGAPASEEEEEGEDNESDEYGSQTDMMEGDEMYNTFHSYSEHEVDRTPVYTREENSFDGGSESMSRSRSFARQTAHNQQATFIMRDQGINRLQNPFAEPPVNIEVNMPHGMIFGQNGQVSIDRILESTINNEVELRQVEFYGEFGFAVLNAKTKLLEFRRQLRSNSAIFRQVMTHMFAFSPVEKPSLEESKRPEPVSTFDVQGTASDLKPARLQRQKKNALEIEGMDPLFMENLTSVGLQNIADSHQIHNRISSQARGSCGPHSREQTPVEILSNFISFLGSQTPQRRLELLNSIQHSMQQELSPEMLAAARNLYQANGEDFTRLMSELREQSRLGTLNVQSSELAGVAQLTEQPRRTLRPRLVSMSSVSYDVRGNDDTVERVHDQQVPSRPRLGSIVKFVEIDGRNKIQLKGTQYMQNFYQLLQDHIVKFENDASTQTVTQQCETILAMTLVPIELDSAEVIHAKLQGLINLGMTVLQNQKEMEIENPGFTDTLESSMSMIDRIPYLRSCITLQVLSILNREIQSMKTHLEVTLGQAKSYLSTLFTFDSQTCSSRRLSLYEVTTFALNCICQMQEIASKSSIQKVQKKREIIQPLTKEPVLYELAKLIGGIDLSKSIMEGLFETIQTLFEAVNADPWLLWGSGSVEDPTKFHKETFGYLLKVIKSIQGAFQTCDQSLIPVSSICKLFLSLLNDNWSPNTQTTSIIKKALAICCYDRESSRMVSSHIKTLIDQLLVSTVSQLKQWGSHEEITVTILKITQLINLIGGLDKSVEVCSEPLLLEVFDTANQIMQREAKSQVDPAHQVSKFMQRQDIRDLIALLISLSEFSIKTDVTQQTSKEASKQNGDEDMVSTFQIPQQQSLPDDEIDKLLSDHVNKSSVHYLKLRAMATFFIANKQLLNQFIRSNQQLITGELKNLVLRIPSILEFDTKRFIWRVELKKQHTKHRKRVIRISVHRERAFDDSFAHLQSLKQEDWKSTFDIQFVNEDGIDQGGLTKEWFMLLSKQMFDENLALFVKANQGGTYFFNPKSTVQSNFSELFNFVGKIIGKALWEQQLLDCYFIKAFYKMMLEMPLNHHDLEDYDEGLYKSLMWILDNPSVEQLSSYFVETMDYFGTQREVELVNDGRNKLVTDENKQDYVRLVANFKLDRAISEQKTAFLNGFYSLVPKDLLKMFDNYELELLISGRQKIDIDDLRENTIFANGYNARSRPVVLLFEVLQELNNSERAEFLQFVTGSSKVPIEGFKGLRGPDGFQKFTIARIQTHGELRLPQSHTCMNTLDLPEYKDKETLRKMLLLAIREGKNFGIA